MARHETRLARRESVARGTMAFHFNRPPVFRHQAGQSILLTFGGESKPFTVASAPHEPELMIATRMRDSAFKRALGAAPPGSGASFDGPNGIMVLHEDVKRPAVFLAGGIGITPFLSMARHAARERLPHLVYLFYANRTPEDAPFLDELKMLEKKNANFCVVATMTEAQKSSLGWSGETGKIDREMLERHLPDPKAPIYYFAGPPGMTMAMQAMLDSLGIAETDMRSEEFYGY